MRDYTEEIINNSEVGILTTFILKKAGGAKLRLVKTLKDITGLGLKDAKDFVDECDNQDVMFRCRMSKDELSSFRKRLDDCPDIKYELEDKTDLRHRKLMSMGLCDRSEVVAEISKLYSYEIMKSSDDILSLLGEVLSYVSDDKILELYNNKMKEYI